MLLRSTLPTVDRAQYIQSRKCISGTNTLLREYVIRRTGATLWFDGTPAVPMPAHVHYDIKLDLYLWSDGTPAVPIPAHVHYDIKLDLHYEPIAIGAGADQAGKRSRQLNTLFGYAI